MFSRLRFYSGVITRTLFSIKMLFRVQVFQSPGFSGSRFFRVQVFQGSGFSGHRVFRVRVQILEVALLVVSSVRKIAKHALNIFGIYYKIFNVSLTILLILGVIGLRLSFFYHILMTVYGRKA